MRKEPGCGVCGKKKSHGQLFCGHCLSGKIMREKTFIPRLLFVAQSNHLGSGLKTTERRPKNDGS